MPLSYRPLPLLKYEAMRGSQGEGIRGDRGMYAREKEMKEKMKEKIKEKIGCRGYTRGLDT